MPEFLLSYKILLFFFFFCFLACDQVIKLTEVVCGVGNVLQNKGGIGAYVRVDRTKFLLVAAHLAAHQARASPTFVLYGTTTPPVVV